MDAAGEPPGAGGVPPPAAFFGLWPRIAEHDPAAAPRLVAPSAERADPSPGEMRASVRLA